MAGLFEKQAPDAQGDAGGPFRLVGRRPRSTVTSRRASGVQQFDAPVRVPSRRGLAIAVTLATWALLVVTVPLYFVFLLNSLPELFAVVAGMRANATAGSATGDGPTGEGPTGHGESGDGESGDEPAPGGAVND